MTEKEAIKILKKLDLQISLQVDGVHPTKKGLEAREMAIKALEEIQQYRSIGTVEECREAVERQRGKKPVKYDNCGNKTVDERCQNCFEIVGGKYCENCGQRILLKESED